MKYPGNPLKKSGVVSRDALHAIVVRPGRRLGQSFVLHEGKPLSLNRFLLDRNATPMDKRFPVVGFGSNSDPQVMANKFERFEESHHVAVSRTFPMFPGTLTNVVRAHLGRPSSSGGFAYALVPSSERSQIDVTISFLDEGQLRAIDETEPNYVRRAMSSNEFPLHLLESLEVDAYGDATERIIETYYLYESLRGVLVEPSGGLFFEPEQASLWQRLGDIDPEFLPLRDELARLGEESQAGQSVLDARRFQQEVNALLAQNELVSPTDLAVFPSRCDSCEMYENIQDGLNPRQTANSPLRVQRTVTGPSERILPEARIQRAEAQRLKLSAGIVEVASAIDDVRVKGKVFRVLANLSIADESLGLGNGIVALDQVIRNAIGVEVGEFVELRNVNLPNHHAHRYIVARRQIADIAIVEQDACILDSIAMNMLGVEPGDSVIVSGAANGANVPSIRLRVFSADDRITLRRAIDGGGLDSRYPSVDETIGVFPDIPWIFMDGDAVKQLNIADLKLMPVLVRASKKSLINKEMRDLLLVIALSILGLWTTVFDFDTSTGMTLKNYAALAVVALVIAASGIALHWRVQSRMGLPFWGRFSRSS